MLPYERQEQLLALLKSNKSATVTQLARTLYVSEASVRRDIERLESRGLVRRVYGGVMLADAASPVPVELRDGAHSAAKEAIARRAAALVKDGDVVILDASSTVRRMVPHLAGRRNVTLITNNLRLFSEPPAGLRLYGTGGIFLPEDHAFAGPAAEAFLDNVRADLVFFSSQGLSSDGEISDASEVQTALRRVMLRRAERKYFLCDASKFGVQRLFTLCHRDALTDILSDAPLPWESAENFAEKT